MAKRKRTTTPRLLRHGNLIAAEALLLVAVVQEVIQRWVISCEIANWLKVLFLMAVNVGAVGVLLIVVQILAEKSLKQTHAVVQVLPVPTPYLLIHLAVFINLFYLHAYIWGAHVWPLP